MPRPRKIKSPEDFGKKTRKNVNEELEMGKTDLSDVPETKFDKEIKDPRTIYEGFIVPMKEVENVAESHEPQKESSPLEELQELEKKLRACTTETPRDIRYKIECNRFILVLQYNSIEVRGDVFCPEMLKGIYIDSRKSELATAQKMLAVLKEWRGEE